jgi:hypothetical protein
MFLSPNILNCNRDLDNLSNDFKHNPTIALIVVIIYYLTIMRNNQKNQQMQLENRQAQMFMQIYSQSQSSEMKKARRIFGNLKWSNLEELTLCWCDAKLLRKTSTIRRRYEKTY